MKEIIPYVISGLALIFSALTVFLNFLKPFEPKILHDNPVFSLYKVTPDISGDEKGRAWWIPSINVDFVFHNIGKVSGEIQDVRVIASSTKSNSETKYTFSPKWIVDYKIFNECRTERFEWVEKAVIRNWYSVLVKAQSETNLHLILETGRWDNKWEGVLKCRLEVLTSKSKNWVNCGEYGLFIYSDMYEEKATHQLGSIDKFKEIENVGKITWTSM